MFYKEYKPALPLNRYIHQYLTLQTDTVSTIEKCIPDGYIKLFIYLNENMPVYTDDKGDQKTWKDGIGGHPVAGNLYIQSLPDIRMVCCVLKPAFFYQISGIPVHELNNSITDLDLLFGKEVIELKEQMQHALTDQERVCLLDRFFLKKLRNQPTARQSILPLEQAQNLMLIHQGRMDISTIGRLVNISERSLERHFLSHIGVTPKYYSRILRFNHAYQLQKAGSQPDWNDIAFICGYYDQNHFIKEFKHFTSTPPTSFYAQAHLIQDVYLGK